MRRILALPLATAISSCVTTPVTAPAPVSFHTTRPAKEAAQVAAVALVNAGFRVSQSDSAGQAISATRTATHNGNQEYVTCDLPRGSAAAANRETSLTINFGAKPSSSGSDITVGSKVMTSYPGYSGTSMEIAPNETDCVSNGVMERQLEASLR
jgi:hypothetical protein